MTLLEETGSSSESSEPGYRGPWFAVQEKEIETGRAQGGHGQRESAMYPPEKEPDWVKASTTSTSQGTNYYTMVSWLDGSTPDRRLGSLGCEHRVPRVRTDEGGRGDAQNGHKMTMRLLCCCRVRDAGEVQCPGKKRPFVVLSSRCPTPYSNPSSRRIPVKSARKPQTCWTTVIGAACTEFQKDDVLWLEAAVLSRHTCSGADKDACHHASVRT